MAKSLNENYIAHIAAVFGGAELYQSNKTKNPEIITFSKAKNQLAEKRLNCQLKDLFLKRKMTFLPRLQVQESFSDEEIEGTLNKYFRESPTEDDIKAIYKMFKAVQKYAKGEAGAKYVRAKKEIGSGTYNDEEITTNISILY